MRKQLFLLLAALFAGTLLAASELDPFAPQYRNKWSICQIGILAGTPTDTLDTAVYGVKVGAPVVTGAPVAGVEAAVLYAGSSAVVGFQGSLIAADAKEVTGLQLSLVNFVQSCYGLQLGIYNSAEKASFQFGLLNHIEGAWIPWMPICNFKF